MFYSWDSGAGCTDHRKSTNNLFRATSQQRKSGMKDRIDAVRQKLEDEINEVRHELEVDLPVRIEEARSKGDLSENAEYESAKERQGYLHVRMAQLQSRHQKLSSINLDDIDPNSVGLYSTVEMKETGNGKQVTYELVLPEEMDIKKGRISIMSPIGQQLRGKTAGDVFTIEIPARSFEVEILGFTNILGEEFSAS
ncbi:transcription elongation factor GreA [bacterium]|nr:transcription elongation factor GreA [bacterium]